MKKNTIIWIAVLGVLVLLFVWGNNRYNYMVSGEELVSKAWSDVESQYQRRSDLLPNLVETVKGYAKHEKSTLQAVIEARAKATQVTVNPDNMTPEKLAE